MARRRPLGKVVVEQARDLSALGGIIADAQIDAGRIGAGGALVLVAWRDDDPVGVAEITCHVDAALLGVLWVAPAMRRGGIGTVLLAAVRKAARVRGARRLYAFAGDGWLRRSGFTPADLGIERGDELWLAAMKPPMASGRVAELQMLDIAQDGIIDR